ncbi:MAG: DNA (cytosine-5-)-methyltransferase [Phascolarctobacterium sp.]|nr:DNA (cytosine-5-)-methyltransferase [Phascolarctobacterium sp.]
MKKTVCELFAGVGGFRCGLNKLLTAEDLRKVREKETNEKWKTVWFSQWEPAEKSTQYAHSCYVYNFGNALDLSGNDTTNEDISTVDKASIPDFNLLVGGFPCQDYSVASTLKSSKGLEGKKGVLWWSIRETVEVKRPPFILLENVDRLLKSPAKQRGRDFAVILGCLRDLGYTVEWRVINAAEYGKQQRRRRTFIFAYENTTKYCGRIDKYIGVSRTDEQTNLFEEEKHYCNITKLFNEEGFFARVFPVETVQDKNVTTKELPREIGEISASFSFNFENAGAMIDGVVYTATTKPNYQGKQITLGDVLESEDTIVDEKYFVPEERIYYTDPSVTHSDETEGKLGQDERQTWQYIKGAKKLKRQAANGHEYIFSEGAMSLLDEYDKPARTMLTSEGSFNRSTHIVRDKRTGRIRLLTAAETERIQGFPTDTTKFCKNKDGSVTEMPENKRRFMMGNALVVNLIADMEVRLEEIFRHEPKDK